MIRTPYGKQILIDGGGTLSFRKKGEEWKDRKDPYEVGKKLLVPLLKKRGVHHIDLLILSHEDADHSGGLQAVAKQIPISNFLFNGTYKPNKGIKELFETAEQLHIPLLAATATAPVRIDPLTTLQIIYPSEKKSSQVRIEEDQNERSIVCILDMDGTRWLFTGDMESGAERSLLNNDLTLTANNKQRPVDVLKVAHHGSKTSTTQEWLDYWKPRIAVISVGAMNSYGHPSPSVVDRLEQNKIQLFRTDLLGEIQMEVHNHQLYSRTKLE
ncbi:ComEC/Rec2 family competence protein [Paenibacillus hexagrammi]|uniref:MBL fold metallo-hydrolase n=1 Tax=Paenibacillus hexagrammi TaxID=2908839 RepID=A0ABY3SLU2_9BACL|nr:MBL fold metallo-hydrolase [Paenibacillus sp. YPD9-1]UJF35032.1 MBL fold metallo-hydrolase [Paenibacillus sp. YPD9-1]